MKFGICLFFTSWLIAFPLYSQFSEDFSDGNLDGWQGDAIHFIVNANQQMQLNAAEGLTTSWIHSSVTFTDSMTWELYIKLDFAPSTSNQLKIYLGVNNPDLSTASGYFLEIGTSGDQDPLELKYLDQGVSIPLATSAPGVVALEPVELTIRVTKKSNGVWQCFKLGEVVPELLFTTTHDELPLSELTEFGFSCKYTDTRRDKFFFDNISIQPILSDIIAPKCISINIIDSNSVILVFDEILEAASANDPAHFILSPGNLNPDQIILNQNEISLSWTPSFVTQLEYTLSIQNIQDPAGNLMLPDQKTFTYIKIDKANPFDLLITEIMADPTPVIGLPDAEYLEIHNASAKVFNLSDYVIQIGASERVLPDELIMGGEFVIVCDEDNAALLAGFGRTIEISGLPSLTNSGTSVILKNGDDEVLHEVNYSLSWYADPGKSDGGWSLEMINPLHICSEAINWAAADNLEGGTPGDVNSRWSTTPDTEGPEFISLYTSSPQKILLRWNENLDEVLMENPSAYTILPVTGISSVVLIDPSTVEISLSQPLEPGIVYLFLPFDAYDCLGNEKAFTDTIRFGLIAEPVEGDILINEILFNPGTGGSRFIEVINVSQKFISLNALAIGRITPNDQDIYATGIDEIIGPGELAAFTSDRQDILSRYNVPQPQSLYMATLPSWNDKKDNAAIIAGGIILDSFTYASSWHHPVIADQNGVSLERVTTDSPSSSSSTWHSASSTAGYATPTGPNSQLLSPAGESETPFSVTNKLFSPDEDGFKDFLALNFQLSPGDYIGSAWIYDLEGREISRLLSNESLGTSTIVQWDGRTMDGLLAEMGIYIIFVQLWDAMGNVREYQETCALIKR